MMPEAKDRCPKIDLPFFGVLAIAEMRGHLGSRSRCLLQNYFDYMPP